MADVLFGAWRTPGDPWLSTGSFELSGGGYVQWTRIGEADSSLHVEINEGLDYGEPMPTELVAALVELGWAEPTEEFRNCWLHAHPADEDGFRAAAEIVLDGAELVEQWQERRAGPRPAVDSSAQRLTLSADSTTLTGHGRTVRVTGDGGLTIEGHDLGQEVAGSWGGGLTEYEFTRILGPAAVDKLRSAAGFGDQPVLVAIRDRFADTSELESFLGEHSIETTFWSRVGF